MATAMREFGVVEHRDSPAVPKRRSFGELIRVDPLSTIITMSIDALSATVAAVVGLWWSVRDRDVIASPWMALLYVPLVVTVMGVLGVSRIEGLAESLWAPDGPRDDIEVAS